MSKILCVVAALLLCMRPLIGWTQTASQLSSDDVDNSFFEALARSTGFRTDLHTLVPGVDGVRGLGVASEPGKYSLYLPYRSNYPSYRKREDAELHGFYCRAAAIVVARVLDTSSYLVPDGTFIYTKTRLSVTQILKPGLGIVQGADIAALAPGGIVKDRDETLEIAIDGGVQFAQGGIYLLALRPRGGLENLFVPLLPQHLPSPQDLANGEYVIDPTDAIGVEDSRIHPLGVTAKKAFEASEPLSALKHQWTALIAMQPCPADR